MRYNRDFRVVKTDDGYDLVCLVREDRKRRYPYPIYSDDPFREVVTLTSFESLPGEMYFHEFLSLTDATKRPSNYSPIKDIMYNKGKNKDKSKKEIHELLMDIIRTQRRVTI